MINTSKITQKTLTAQVAGLLPGDSNIEFWGEHDTQEVLWIQNGRTLPFQYLPKWAYRLLQKQYLNDKPAVTQLSQLNVSNERQVELYTYYMWGDIDSYADIKDGVLQPCENYRHSKDDASLDWDYKWITIGEVVLNKRDIFIIDMLMEDALDETIAAALNITVSTFAFHKKNLFIKSNVQSRTGLIIAALNHHV